MKKVKRLLCILLSAAMVIGFNSISFAEEKNDPPLLSVHDHLNHSILYANEPPLLTMDFVKEAQLSVAMDDKGEQVAMLTHAEKLPSRTRSESKNYAQTTLAILGKNTADTAKIIKNIQELQRGTGQLEVDDWFYGSSVYLSSTIYYTTTPISTGFNVIALNKVAMQCTTNSGSSVSKMTLTMIQHGPCYPDSRFRMQEKTFDAKIIRSFDAPSSWYPVDMTSPLSAVGAAIECTAIRPGGTSSTFRLPNNIVG